MVLIVYRHVQMVGPLNLVLCGGLDLHGKKQIRGHPRAHCEVYEISGVGQIYLIGGSSDAAFSCHFGNNLLFTSTGSAVCAAVDVSKAFDTVGR